MPEIDCYKSNRLVDIEFIYQEKLLQLPRDNRYTMVLVTNGSLNFCLNDYPIRENAPFMICLSFHDRFTIINEDNLAAQAFHFHPEFFDTKRFMESDDYFSNHLKIKTGMSLFTKEKAVDKVFTLSDKIYPKIYEWFFIIGSETHAHSDHLWVCRMKSYLLKILDILDKLSLYKEKSPLNLALEYIHVNYSEKITTDDITKYAHLNRVSLNKLFQELCQNTAMGYLMEYRLSLSENLLTHTDMSLNEVARMTGFEYDTYFIKQFSKRRNMTPTQFRKSSRKFVTQTI